MIRFAALAIVSLAVALSGCAPSSESMPGASVSSVTPTSGDQDAAKASNSDPGAERVLVLNVPSEVNFEVADFPVGWEMTEQKFLGFSFQPARGDSHSLTVVKAGDVQQQISSTVKVYPDRESGSASFREMRQNTSATASVADLNIADDSFIYAAQGNFHVVFRSQNVIATISMVNQDGHKASMEETQEWASTLAAKIVAKGSSVQPNHPNLSLADFSDFCLTQIPAEVTADCGPRWVDFLEEAYILTPGGKIYQRATTANVGITSTGDFVDRVDRVRVEGLASLYSLTGQGHVTVNGQGRLFLINSLVYVYDDESRASEIYESVFSRTEYEVRDYPDLQSWDEAKTHLVPDPVEVFVGRKGNIVVGLHISRGGDRSAEMRQKLVSKLAAKVERCPCWNGP